MSGAIEALAWASLALALLPLALAAWNLALYRPPRGRPPPGTAVSVLIPARNEEANVGDAVRSVLASRDVAVEVVVLDDHSTDRTAAVVAGIARADPRVRLERAPPLPSGWSGKQHACQVLAERARHPVLLFMDADVRLAPDAVARAAAFLTGRDLALASGFPREETGSVGERLLIPLIHVLLIGYLPMAFMRRFRAPALGAACGQFILVRREAHAAVGGHGAIRRSLHDGVTLPRAFRRAGYDTDLFDATDLATCRMYRGWRETWAGFSKNATEGMARPVALPVWTVLLLGGHVLPWLLLAAGPAPVRGIAAAAAASGLVLRLVLARRFRQGTAGALLHPAGVLALLALQWSALVRAARGRPAAWRGRTYPVP